MEQCKCVTLAQNRRVEQLAAARFACRTIGDLSETTVDALVADNDGIVKGRLVVHREPSRKRSGFYRRVSSQEDAETTERAEPPGPPMVARPGPCPVVSDPDIRVNARALLATPGTLAWPVTDALVLAPGKRIAADRVRQGSLLWLGTAERMCWRLTGPV
jgi:hypothetical protein